MEKIEEKIKLISSDNTRLKQNFEQIKKANLNNLKENKKGKLTSTLERIEENGNAMS